MKAEQIIRAWKDEAYLGSLSAEERSLLPQNPAGFIEVPDDVLDQAAGGSTIVVTIVTTVAVSEAVSCWRRCYDYGP